MEKLPPYHSTSGLVWCFHTAITEGLGLMPDDGLGDDEDWTGRDAHHALCSTTKQKLLEVLRSTVHSHDDHIDIEVAGEPDNFQKWLALDDE